MVAVTKKIPYKELIKPLNPGEKVLLFTCNTCPRLYETGGVDVMSELEKQLEADGFHVKGKIILASACFEDYMQQMMSLIPEDWSTGFVLACESGWGVVKSYLPDKRILRGLITVGIQQGRQPKPVELLEG
jgi:hypothetical protein